MSFKMLAIFGKQFGLSKSVQKVLATFFISSFSLSCVAWWQDVAPSASEDSLSEITPSGTTPSGTTPEAMIGVAKSSGSKVSQVRQFSIQINGLMQQIDMSNQEPFSVQSHSSSPSHQGDSHQGYSHQDSGNQEKRTSFYPQIQLPLPEGGVATVVVEPVSVMSPELAKKYPSIKTFRLNHQGMTGRMDMTPQGVHVMLQTKEGSVFIDPVQGEQDVYQSRYKGTPYAEGAEAKSLIETSNYVHEHVYEEKSPESSDGTSMLKSQALSSNGTPSESVGLKTLAEGNLRVYRLALAATGEYTQYHGGTKESALAAMVTTINRVNEIFERDLAIRLELVGRTDELIYLDGDNDPYTNRDASAMMAENQVNIDQVIGVNAYDIGHVFGTSGGGIARLSSVCDDGDKASAATGHHTPHGDSFAVDFVAHEMGHQLSAEHSFNGTTSACANRSSGSAYEPGSGSTIMSYAGLCGAENLQFHSDAVFHASSQDVILNYVTVGKGSSCGRVISTGNEAPLVNAGSNYFIPANTPFELRGAALDGNGDELTYSWEQYDLGAASSQGDMGDEGSRPIFRSFLPVSDAGRVFPQWSDLLHGRETIGEWLPASSRVMDFRLTARDGHGGIGADSTRIEVSDLAGPFQLLNPLSGDELDDQFELMWDVAGTDLPPVECFNVDVFLSNDNGQNFDILLAQGIDNDGSHWVTLPDDQSYQARIKLQCSNNIFFAISPGTFSYTGTGNALPSVMDDHFVVLQDSESVWLNVLENDGIQQNASNFTITDVSTLDQGGFVVVENNRFYYTPAQGFEGTETFSYSIMSDSGEEATAQVKISVIDQSSAQTPNVPLSPSTSNGTPASSSKSSGGSFSLLGFVFGFLYLLLMRSRRRP